MIQFTSPTPDCTIVRDVLSLASTLIPRELVPCSVGCEVV